MTVNIGYPFAIGSDGRTGTASAERHLRDLIEQLLLTYPGERVNRPDFGAGVYQLVFAPNSPELAATLQLTLQAAIQRYLADVISVQRLTVSADDSRLLVQVEYTTRDDRTVTAAQIEVAPAAM